MTYFITMQIRENPLQAGASRKKKSRAPEIPAELQEVSEDTPTSGDHEDAPTNDDNQSEGEAEEEGSHGDEQTKL